MRRVRRVPLVVVFCEHSGRSLRALAEVGQAGEQLRGPTLGRLQATLVRRSLQGTELLAKVEPLLLLNRDMN